jgi:ABC-type multidrug transport system ATPase subunit
MTITELTKDFNSLRVDVQNMVFEDGFVHGLIGPNGCGKTTLAKLIMGTVPAQRRDIDFGGLDDRDMTMATQQPYMMHDSVYRNLVFPLKLRGLTPDRQETDRLLGICGLLDKAKDPARGLSSGQQQKLSIARALIFKPKLIIIDESLSSLDPDSVELFETEIRRIQKEAPVTWLIISHQLAHVRRLCDRIHFMDKGRIIKSGTFDQVLNRPEEPELSRYIARETL